MLDAAGGFERLRIWLAFEMGSDVSWGMHCRGCGYRLIGLDRAQCPECSRAFDSMNPASFSARPLGWLKGAPEQRWFVGLFTAAALSTVLLQLFVLILFCAACLVLGRWPHRWGMDDPKHITVVKHFHVLLYLLLPFTFIAAPMFLAVLPWTIRPVGLERRWIFAPALTLAGFAIWGLGFILIRVDPGQVWTWIMD